MRAAAFFHCFFHSHLKNAAGMSTCTATKVKQYHTIPSWRGVQPHLFMLHFWTTSKHLKHGWNYFWGKTAENKQALCTKWFLDICFYESLNISFLYWKIPSQILCTKFGFTRKTWSLQRDFRTLQNHQYACKEALLSPTCCRPYQKSPKSNGRVWHVSIMERFVHMLLPLELDTTPVSCTLTADNNL